MHYEREWLAQVCAQAPLKVFFPEICPRRFGFRFTDCEGQQNIMVVTIERTAQVSDAVSKVDVVHVSSVDS